MIANAIIWTWKRLRPAEGWLALLLLWVAIGCLTGAVVEADWVPEGRVVIAATLVGLAFGAIQAGRPLPTAPAWTLILLYGLLLVTLYLGRLLPPWRVIFAGWETYAQFNRQQVALFVDRWAGWIKAIADGGSSRETIVFAFGLGMTAWLLAAYAAWSTFRQRQPLRGLGLVGLALAVNGYYGSAPIWYAVVFVTAATLLTATLNYAYLEQDWEQNQISYPTGIQIELLAAAGVVASLLLVLATTIPSIHLRELTRAFLEQPVVQQTEETLSRAFAGVRPPREDAALFVGAGLFPNDFLIGNAPELATTVVMTATVRGNVPAGLHWRGLSYDVYNGRGWEVSTERRESVAAQMPIPIPPISQSTTITQTVAWLFVPRSTRYTLGLPRQFDQPVAAYWRGADDLSQVRGAGSAPYTALSTASAADEAAWRLATLAAVPPLISGRYTQLPANVPARVVQLAQEITAPYAAPYDQARAIETFLRQYPYTLDVELPPTGRDPVDYFLFDLQRGYCDYYASAMVVLARAVGLPARLAVGYLAQPPDTRGTQRIVQLNAHSWAEVYFAGYGWLEFEPTAAFSRFSPAAPSTPDAERPPEFLATPAPLAAPPIPPADRHVPVGWVVVGGLAMPAFTALIWWYWRRRHTGAPLDDVQAAYARLLRGARGLGMAPAASQTPLEFADAFCRHMQPFADRPRLAAWAETARTGATRLARLFMRHQYAPPAPPAATDTEAPAIWRHIRRPLWLLRLARRIRPHPPPPPD
ncbi:MAG: transglutaminase domain-containing protein [Anaerolineales bacterium]|nr:transglutaminase domain-containing protein [Anaerolineales bacterium]MCB8952693.1 transglutaminase domain-containing protein [Ardenticatenales bacterium]